jgi:MerR family transcriptional regulator, light-induced transcriptional regulator
LREAAESLGVHYMTAYRYVRLGMLPAHKEGASWRVNRDDLEAFRHRGEAAGDSPGDSEGTGPRGARWESRLESRLLAGDERGAWGVIEAALASGMEPPAIYLDLVAPAMRSIG